MNNKKLYDIVNRSGFPFQIALENLVNTTKDSHGWDVIYTEHSWKNPADGESGFIDLVLKDRYGTSKLIIESKRVLESSWIFLIDKQKQLARRHAKSWFMRYRQEKFTHFGLRELTLEPSTAQSQYCVVDGQDAKRKPMLERIASDVISSIEGFAHEEKKLQIKNREGFNIYFGAIVTTAKLKICSLDPNQISMTTGTINDAEFSEVPYLRFRKQLTSHNEVEESYAEGGHRQISRAKESTVFIVNSEALPKFLNEFDVDDASFYGVL